jgi:tetratricopeptide (TPR) repeat protein
MYPHPGRAIAFGSVLLAGVVLLTITAMVLLFGRRRGYLLTGWLWFLGAMVPMIGLVQVGSQARADRYAYLPFIGLFLVAAWAAADMAERWPASRWLVAAGVTLALASLGLATWRQVAYWRDPEVLWNHALETTKGNFVAHDSLAGYLIQRGRMDEACGHFDASLQIFPGDIPAQEGLGVCAQARGDLPTAIQYYENVLRLSVDDTVRASTFGNVGSIYRQLGKFTLAKENYDAALQLNPDLPIALVGSGLLAQKGWDFAKAAQEYQHAMSVEPTSVGYLLLGKALEQSGRPVEAQTAYAQAQRLSTNFSGDRKAAEELLAK